MGHSLLLSYSSSPPFKHSPLPAPNHFPSTNFATFSCSITKPSPHAVATATPTLKNLNNCNKGSILKALVSKINKKNENCLPVHKINLNASRTQTLAYTHGGCLDAMKEWVVLQMFQREMAMESLNAKKYEENDFTIKDLEDREKATRWATAFLFGQTLSVISPEMAHASETVKMNEIYEVGELFDLSIQLLYLLLLLGLLGAGTYFVIRQVLVRRELDLSAKELQEQVRSGDANATGLFELGAVMLRRKFYPAATKYLLQAIEKWDGDEQDLAQVHNALGVSYVRDDKLDKGIAQFETAVKLQPGYVTAWNNLGDAYEKKKEYKAALKAFEEVLLFDPNNKIARPRRDAMKEQVEMYKGVPLKSKEKR